MSHPIMCPECQMSLRVPEEAAGRSVRCPGCRTPFTVRPWSEDSKFYLEVPAAPEPPAPESPAVPPTRRHRGPAFVLVALLLILSATAAGIYAVAQAVSPPPTAASDEPNGRTDAAPVKAAAKLAEDGDVGTEPAEAVTPLVTEERTEKPANQTGVQAVKDGTGQAREIAPVPFPIYPTPLVKYQRAVAEFGIVALRDHANRPLNKRLTYSEDGVSSRTVLRIDGTTTALMHVDGGPTTTLPDDPARRAYFRTERVFQADGLTIRHILEVVPGQQPVDLGGVRQLLLDTVLSRYVITNEDKVAHQFGLRTQVDTLIGDNDRVPFTVPGRADLMEAADFPGPVPAFIQALENADLRNPGTVARMTFQVGTGVEAPSRVSITNWYQDDGRFDVPVQESFQDTCVVLYWPVAALPPGGRRDIGFAYGLGQVDAREAGGKLGLTLGGAFEPGRTFTVTALVTNPLAGQTATLAVPAGLAVDGPATLPVPPANGQNTSVLTWNVRAERAGDFSVSVTSGGNQQSRLVSVTPRELRLGTLNSAK